MANGYAQYELHRSRRELEIRIRQVRLPAGTSLSVSINNTAVGQLGVNGDISVAGNFDGDTKTDIAVFRPSSGFWYILRSSDGTFQSSAFGADGDIPVAQ